MGSQCSHFGMALMLCVVSLLQRIRTSMGCFSAINLMLGQGRGGFMLWYDYLNFCVVLPDDSVLWTLVRCRMMALCFGLQRIHSVHTLVWLVDVCCLFAATDSHFRCFSAMTSCLVGVLWGGFTLLCDYVSQCTYTGLCDYVCDYWLVCQPVPPCDAMGFIL